MPKMCPTDGCRHVKKGRRGLCVKCSHKSGVAKSRPTRNATVKRQQRPEVDLSDPCNGVLVTHASDEDLLGRLDRFAREFVRDNSDQRCVETGVRKVYEVHKDKHPDALEKLETILSEMTKSLWTSRAVTGHHVAGWVTDPVLDMVPAVVVAPVASYRSPPHRKGKIHRDHDPVASSQSPDDGDQSSDDESESPDDVDNDGKDRDLLVCMVFLDDIDDEKGTICFWENSMDAELDLKHRKTSVERVEAAERKRVQSVATDKEPGIAVAKGKRGTVHMWNGLLLHQSMPNRDKSTSTYRVQWFVKNSFDDRGREML